MSGYGQGGGRFQAPQREKNAADARELTLYGIAAQPGGKPATMVFSTFNNSPRFRVYRTDGKMLEFKLDQVSLNEVLTTLEDIARRNQPEQVRWNLDGFVAQGKKGIIGTLIAGRGEDGLVYIGATGFGWDKPERFNFRPYFRFKRVDAQGNEIPAQDVSALLARSWARLVRDISLTVYINEYKHPEPKQRPQQGGNGGYNNNNGGGYNNSGNGGYQNQGGYNQQPSQPSAPAPAADPGFSDDNWI